jgi:YHS domain-containing protein
VELLKERFRSLAQTFGESVRVMSEIKPDNEPHSGEVAIHENSIYVADQMVENPIAQMRFPKYAAEATLQKEGITYYFISSETKRDFQNGRPRDKNSHRQETLCEIRGS